VARVEASDAELSVKVVDRAGKLVDAFTLRRKPKP
jgi:hypothetical protein